jgi:6-pyruvoyltetrahydropterin/6-carboxytetrahydropterin synthase
VPKKPSRRKPAARSLSGTVLVTRRVHFNAAHQLYNPAFSPVWNKKAFGLCANPHWHGHNYVLEVTVHGEPDPDTGFVINLVDLKRILHEAVADKCDHRNLNEEVGFLRGILPTTENLVIAFWREIEPRLKSGRLHCVRLYETERNFAEYFGPQAG